MGRADLFCTSNLVKHDIEWVTRHWGRPETRARDGGPPRRILASDVWDLFRRTQGAAMTVWGHFVSTLEPNALLLIVGGSPCNNLLRAGRPCR
eukprot:6377685-Pyramimonas_sp.AAC.1